ncbi:MAG: P-loop NTPase [Candidatus Alcyoniella australis]|nr:P-loop NTPase [Candidatus Alcyoniella australis]
MNIAIASGKGGTGKTTFAVNLAYALAERGDKVRLLDCDVEEPNDHLFVQPEFTERKPVEVMKPVWKEKLCTGCGKCAEACHYNAIAVVKSKVLIFNELCHSCGVCSYICPEKALWEKPVEIGWVELAPENQPFFFAHGILNIAEALAPSVVRQVKTYCDPETINIIDASPGTSCPVVESVTDADVAILVTEPTPFGLNDLKLAVGLALERKVPTGIIVNRSDGTDTIIAEYAERVGVPIVGRIPYKREYAEAYSGGAVLTHIFPELKDNLLGIYDDLLGLVGSLPPDPPEEEDFFVTTETLKPFSTGTADNYNEITVISGKGGSGKTTVVASLALLSDNKILADNDVDAADLHLLLAPTVREAHDFVGGQKTVIDASKCTGCGLCADACHFSAIRPDDEQGTYRVDDLACEGCGLCQHVCDFDAISTTPSTVGKWYISGTDYGPMAHARLGIAEENSGRLVAQVRNVAADLARDLKKELILGDGPPGTGCPVIASVSGADRVLIVTEPTVSGVHDMQRVLQLTEHFRIPALIVINKADLNMEQAQRIETIAQEMGSRVIGRIPFDHNVNDALMAGKTVIEYGKGPAFKAIVHLGDQLSKAIQ